MDLQRHAARRRGLKTEASPSRPGRRGGRRGFPGEGGRGPGWKTLCFLLLFLFLFTGAAGRSEALLYDIGFETGNTSRFTRTVPPDGTAFAGNETAVVRKGRYSGRVSLSLLEQRAYVEKVLETALPEVHVKCALRLGDDLEVFLVSEILSLIGSNPEAPVASVVLEDDLTLSLVYFNINGRLVSVPASGVLGPLEPGRWHEIELYYRSDFLPEGELFELFIDGVKTLSVVPVYIQSLAASVCYGQRMDWQQGTKAQGTVYFDICKGSTGRLIGQEPDKVAAVLVDRSPSAAEAYDQYASERVKGFLDHVGLPYLEMDVPSLEIVPERLLPFDLVILGQEGLGGALAREEQTAISEAVYQGVGLYSFDPWLDRYESPAFQGMLGNPQTSGMEMVANLEVPGTDHFITALQPSDPGDRLYEWPGSVAQQILTDAGSGRVLAVTDRGPALLSGGYGRGRFCTWLLQSGLWAGSVQAGSFQFLGHLHGADDLLWRGIVWTGRKPMAWRPLPESMLALKVDDCRGRGFGGAPFEYLEMASDLFGVSVHTSIFLDAVTGTKVEHLRTLQQEGVADVSAHAFDGGDTNPDELPAWQVYWNIRDNAPFPAPELASKWQRVDDYFDRHGLEFSSVFAPSFAEAGIENLPYLDDHDIVYVNTIHDFGTVAGTGTNLWLDSRPFRNGAQALDAMGDGAGPFNVSSWADFNFWSFDYLIRYDTFPFEAVAGPEEAWENASRQIRFAHAARFPMVLLTHEYVLEVAGMDLDSWGRFLTLLRNGLQEQGVEPMGLPQMIGTVRDYVGSRILSYERGPYSIVMLLEGNADSATSVELWFPDDTVSYASVPAFRGSQEIEVPTGVPPSPEPGDGGCGCSHFAEDPGAPLSFSMLAALLPALAVLGWSRALRRRIRKRPLPNE